MAVLPHSTERRRLPSRRGELIGSRAFSPVETILSLLPAWLWSRLAWAVTTA
jgi:hypothetical protein